VPKSGRARHIGGQQGQKSGRPAGPITSAAYGQLPVHLGHLIDKNFITRSLF